MTDQFDDFAAERDLSWEALCVLPYWRKVTPRFEQFCEPGDYLCIAWTTNHEDGTICHVCGKPDIRWVFHVLGEGKNHGGESSLVPIESEL
jgi:hypothetical protein